jgi:hypothetical protein
MDARSNGIIVVGAVLQLEKLGFVYCVNTTSIACIPLPLKIHKKHVYFFDQLSPIYVFLNRPCV